MNNAMSQFGSGHDPVQPEHIEAAIRRFYPAAVGYAYRANPGQSHAYALYLPEGEILVDPKYLERLVRIARADEGTLDRAEAM